MTKKNDMPAGCSGVIEEKDKKILDNLTSSVRPDYDHWRSMDYWTLEEAILLVLCIDPVHGSKIINSEKIKKLLIKNNQTAQRFDYSLDPPIDDPDYEFFLARWAYEIITRYYKLHELAERSSDAEHKAFINAGKYPKLFFPPSDFLSWALEKGYGIPEPLQELIPNTVNQSVQVSFLDGEHAVFSAELAMAIAVWTELYQNGEIHNNRGHKDQIKKWLKENYPNSTKGAIERVATIVNPNKKGGAPSTGSGEI